MSNLRRTEIVFLYDSKLNNPNGDPNAGNSPRVDEQTGRCIVTDVRLKRTIRDYLYDKGYNGSNSTLKNQDIFIREIRDEENNTVKSVKQRAIDFLLPNEKEGEFNKVINQYLTKGTGKDVDKKYKPMLISNMKRNIAKENIDIRLFGGTLAMELTKLKVINEKESKGSITYTGPVQFSMGYSLNKVRIVSLGHSFTMASGEDKESGSLATEFIINYGLFGFHGIINENASVDTGLSENDVLELLEGMWHGTKNLLTKSKKGHLPRLMVVVEYNKNENSNASFFIGDLLEKLSLNSKKADDDNDYESINDFEVDVSRLNQTLKENENKIYSISVLKHEGINLSEEIKTKNSNRSYESISI